MSDQRIDLFFTRDGHDHQRGILGVDWNERDAGDLETFAKAVAELPREVRRLECSLCLGRAQESTPVNVYRRLRMRIRQIEATLTKNANLEELRVRFYVTRRGTQPTVETLYATPAINRGFSPMVQYLLIRNRLLHLAQEMAEPTTSGQHTYSDDHEESQSIPIRNRNSSSSITSTSTNTSYTPTDDAATTTSSSTIIITTILPPQERRALWGRALIGLVQRRDRGLTASSIFVLLQKNVDYLPCT